jgi:hypothetical protein
MPIWFCFETAQPWECQFSFESPASASSAPGAAKIFKHFGVENGRAYFVDTHGPFAEVNFAAAIAAKWEVFVGELYKHSAGGAVKQFGGFFLCGHSVKTVRDYVSALRRDERPATYSMQNRAG